MDKLLKGYRPQRGVEAMGVDAMERWRAGVAETTVKANEPLLEKFFAFLGRDQMRQWHSSERTPTITNLWTQPTNGWKAIRG